MFDRKLNYKQEPTTLCWECKNARANRCPRFNRQNLDEPMDIWEEYERSCVVIGNGEYRIEAVSYIVVKCKLYEPEHVKRKKIGDVKERQFQEVLN